MSKSVSASLRLAVALLLPFHGCLGPKQLAAARVRRPAVGRRPVSLAPLPLPARCHRVHRLVGQAFRCRWLAGPTKPDASHGTDRASRAIRGPSQCLARRRKLDLPGAPPLRSFRINDVVTIRVDEITRVMAEGSAEAANARCTKRS